ncbi:hypothetical protein BDN72DRAFT_770433 [Pluteus cervinus]|uniref:Uncharacterized protein n=1 Tax=Pluteus cervinus TaxID=181527 RepID=A0ACD3ARU9_9AGAR|nr:hypothetical protein BDN72DRAFT_770433 [Pluteus cervinus]
MRQSTESSDDGKFRTALGNMRYKSCTKEDIDFLRTRIHNPYDPKRPKITDEQFRNTSIIVSYNITKDTINNLGCTRFAQETGQDLSNFYSEDSVYVPDVDNMKPRKRKKYKLTSNIPPHVQKWLWQQPTSACDRHIPGCLSVCIGMPVMIRTNLATELCMTKGQEGFVYNWISGKGTKNQDVLYTLFVRLANPPRNIQFEGLPQNVVPIYRTTTRVMVSLPLGPDIPVSRTQVEVLPNFSMTDYSSQGKTRPSNPVDLSNSRTHQHVYTALSRSSTAAGTLILQRLDIPIITGGPSGALRQEFRELEMLDFITQLNYEGKLKANTLTGIRSSTISRFMADIGDKELPKHIHHTIRWSPNDPFEVDNVYNITWQTIKEVPKAKGTTQHKAEIEENQDELKHNKDEKITSQEQKNKKQKTIHIFDKEDSQPTEKPPVGTTWVNNSCAYDAIITVLYNLWKADPQYWTMAFNSYQPANAYLVFLAQDFNSVFNLRMSLSSARDKLLNALCTDFPATFKHGAFASVHQALDKLLISPWNIAHIVSYCIQCYVQPHMLFENTERKSHLFLHNENGLDQTLQDKLRGDVSNSASLCTICNASMRNYFVFQVAPPLLALDIANCPCRIESNIVILVDNVEFKYELTGIIYYVNEHFTSRIIKSSQVWYHNGFVPNMFDQQTLAEHPDLYYYGAQKAVVAIYRIGHI